MRRLLLVAGLTVAGLVPSLASAQPPERQRDNRCQRAEAQRDVDTRANWLEQHIRAAGGSRTLDRAEARSDLAELASIRDQERDMRTGDGRLRRPDEATLQLRLVDLFSRLGPTPSRSDPSTPRR